MDILDFIWYLIKIFGSIALLLFLINLVLSLIYDIFQRGERRKREVEMNNAVMQALKEGRFSVGVTDKKNK